MICFVFLQLSLYVSDPYRIDAHSVEYQRCSYLFLTSSVMLSRLQEQKSITPDFSAKELNASVLYKTLIIYQNKTFPESAVGIQLLLNIYLVQGACDRLSLSGIPYRIEIPSVQDL